MLLLFFCATLRLELVRESLTGTHVRYRQYVQDMPVVGGEVEVSNGREIARRVARVDEEVAPPADANAAVNVGGVVRYARRVVVTNKPLERIAYYYDVETGELLRVEPLYFSVGARVFDPNPVVTLNDPTLQDHNDDASAVPASAYRDVDVPETLSGPYVTIVDRELPAKPPAPGAIYNRNDDGFEDVSAYYHIDANQKYLQSLGYVGKRAVAAYSIPVDAHAAGGSDDSYFIPNLLAALPTGALSFGEGGTDDAEDADIMIHEYGHAVQEWISPGTFTGAFNSEARALSEGTSDYWAFSAHYAQRLASGRDLFCLADWDARCSEDASSERCAYAADANCLRRVDSTKTMADYSMSPSPGTEHQNGAIWSSALRDLFLRVGKRTADTILIESLFGTPPNPTFALMADRMIDADRLLYAGAHAADICAAMTARGIATTCGRLPRGELTRTQSIERGLAIPENNAAGVDAFVTIDDDRPIESLYVNVDVEHPSRGDLRITLTAPDGTTVTLQNPVFDRAADLRVTYGLDAEPVQPLAIFRGRSARGTWKLNVADVAILDVGTLRSWSLVIQFAGDVPSNERPTGTPRQTIPVVGSVYGHEAARFVSDVQLFNPSATREVVATLIFTRGDGEFGAERVTLAPWQTIALDDVVQQTFFTTGIGQLEIIGDVVASSRTYTDHVGQSVRAFTDDDAVGVADGPLRLQQLAREEERSNIGVAEIAGSSGVVRIGGTEYAIVPFGHLQIGAHGETEVAVVSGDARVVAYVSTIRMYMNDAVFVPGVRVPREARTVYAPAISHPFWSTELWRDDGPAHLALPAGLSTLKLELPAGTIVSERIVNNVLFRQFVPFQEARGGTMYATGIEGNLPFRTNIGVIAAVDSVARVVVFDAAGQVQDFRTLSLHAGQIVQFAAPSVTNGSALIEVVSGRIVAYASVIDRFTNDASFLQFAVR